MMVQEFHDGMCDHVQDNSKPSKAFPVTNGVKQGCVLAPILFCMMFSAVLGNAFQNVSLGFDL